MMRRWFSVFSVIVLMTLLAGIVIELAFRLSGYDPRVSAYDLSWKTRVSAEVFSAFKKNPALHLSVRLPPPLPSEKRMHPPKEIMPIRSLTYDPGFRTRDANLGFYHTPNYRGRSVQTAMDGYVNFNVTYTIDSAGRRWTPHEDERERPANLIALGTSDLFGYGVEDAETLPAQLANSQKTYRVLNDGVDIWGPGNILRFVQSPSFANDVDTKKKTVVLYFFYPHHLNRLIGTLNLYRFLPIWSKFLPYYFIDRDGVLRTKGMLHDRTARDATFKLLSLSSLLAYLKVEIPKTLNRDHFLLFEKVMIQIREAVQNRFPDSRFVVVCRPDREPDVVRAAIAALDEAGIQTLDYSSIDLYRYTSSSPELPDLHPSAAANEFLARQLSADLRLDR